MSDDAPDRDCHLYAALESTFKLTPFIGGQACWKTVGQGFSGFASLPMLPGDMASVMRLVHAGKVRHLGFIKNEPYFAVKSQPTTA